MRLRIYLAILALVVVAAGLSSVQDLKPLPIPIAFGAIQPRLSPDGSAIAFAYQGAIWRLPREGGVMRRLTSGAAWDSDPAWSPDGKKIACISGDDLLLLDAESGATLPREPRLAAKGPLYFHPDGNRLLAHVRGSGGFLLSWIPLAGGAPTAVFQKAGERPFALSPDGAKIAYATHQDVSGEQGGNNGPQADLWISPADEDKPVKLTRFASRIFELGWYGTSLVAVSDLGGAHQDLWEIPLTGPEQPRKLTSGQADEGAASVVAGQLLYTDNREGATSLLLRDLSTGEEKTLRITGMDYGKPLARLAFEFVEKGSGQPLAARVAVQEEGGKPVAPPGSLYHLHDGQMDFFAHPDAAFDVPAGRYHVHVSHGLEYRPAHLQVEAPAGKKTPVRVELERWTDPQSRGWFSGENHIHANYGYGHWYNRPSNLLPMIGAEGLNVANFVVANSDTDGVFDREFFRGRPDSHSLPRTILYWNEEFRATLWGHLTLVNLKQLVEPIFTGFADTTNPWDVPTNADIADHTHLQGGHVNYTHPATNVADPYLSAYSGKSLPIDVALGKIDSLDINWSYEPTLSLWYRLLNCGFRVPASAGTDCFLNRIRSRLPGADRAYVRVEGDFSYDAWVKGLKAGRSFVTNGPVLEFAAGETVRLDAPGPLPVKATVSSAAPIDRFEVVLNGKVVAAGTLSEDRRSGAIDLAVKAEKSGWLGVRAFSGRQQAHSSPIYVEVAGKSAASREDAEFFLTWIARLEAQLKKRDRLPGAAARQQVQDQLTVAREVYRRIAARD